MRRLALFVLFFATAAQAQAPSPAQIGVSPTPPQSLYWLDTTKKWQPVYPGTMLAADRTGATDSVMAFTNLFSAVSVNGGTTWTPAGNYALASSVTPGVPNTFKTPYNPGFVRLPIASDLASQWLTFDPGAKSTGAGILDLRNLFPYIVAPVIGDDVLIHTFTDSDAKYANYMVRSTIAYNNGTTVNKMPVVADFMEGISNCGVSGATLNCPAWGANIVGFATADFGHAWGAEIDVGDLSPTGNATVWGIDMHAIGVNPSTFGLRFASNQDVTSGFTFGLYFDSATGHPAITTNGYLMLANGIGWKAAHALALDRWVYSSDELVIPQLYVGPTPSTTASYATTAASVAGTTATVTYTGPFTPLINQNITVAGVTPTAYNGVFLVTAKSNGSISYSCSACTGTQTVAGTVSWVQSQVASRVQIAGGTTATGGTAPKISVFRPYSWDSTGALTDGDLRLGGAGAGQLLFESAVGTTFVLDALAASGANISSYKLEFRAFDSAAVRHKIHVFGTNAGTSPILQFDDEAGGTAINFTVGGASPKISTTGTSDLVLAGGGTGAVSITAGLKAAALPASAGAGGIFLCVDSAGVIYKKATCP